MSAMLCRALPYLVLSFAVCTDCIGADNAAVQTLAAATVRNQSQADAAEPPSSPWPLQLAPTAALPAASGSFQPNAAYSYAVSPTAAAELPSPSDAAGSAPSEGQPGLLPDDDARSDPTWYRPSYWIGPSPWDTGIELGLNGATGTNEAFSLRTGGYAKLESRFSKLDFSIYHNRTSTAGLTTQNNATLDVRNDWLLDESSPWTLFAKGTVFYDQFQAFDLQTNADTGVGYQLLDQPIQSLIGRVGGGASREFGGPDRDWVPEALFGFEYDQHLTPTQKLYCKFDYYPALANFDDYRMVTDAGWEIELVQPSNVSLKLSASDRYDSTPNGADPHLVNYSVLLLLKL